MLIATSACGPSRAGSDAGPDGGPPDTGPADAGLDAALDAAVRDAGAVDAWLPDGSIDWRPVPGLPPICEAVEYAANPIALGTLDIEPCPGSEAWCRRVSPGWPVDGSPHFIVHRGMGFQSGSGGYFVFSRSVGEGIRLVLVGTDGGAYALGFRSPAPAVGACYVGTTAVGEDDTYAVEVVEPDAVDAVASWIFAGDMGRPADGPTLLHRFDADDLRGNGAQDLAPGSSQVGVGLQPGGQVYRLGWDGGTTRVGSFPMDGALAFLAAVVGDAIYFETWGVPYQVRLSIGGASSIPFIDAVEVDAALFRTDGLDMVWVQGYGRLTTTRFDRIELWTAPYVSDPARVSARRVARLSNSRVQPSLRVGFGYAAILESATEIAVYRLSDGAKAMLAAPPDTGWYGGILYLGPEELAVATRRPDVYPRETQDLMFVRYDGLVFE